MLPLSPGMNHVNSLLLRFCLSYSAQLLMSKNPLNELGTMEETIKVEVTSVVEVMAAGEGAAGTRGSGDPC